MRLVIAEKPELGRNIAHAVCGAPEGVRLPFRGEPYSVVACAGHLLEFEEPAEIDPERWGSPWREEVLPMLPRPWPKVVADGKEGLVRTIAKMLREADLVVHAGDPDDEGQLIIDELLEFLGWRGPVMRVMVNDSIDRNIRRAFENMGPNGPHMAAGRSSNARRMADACFGFNESRLASIRAGHGRKLTVGRVQTPTLGLVVERTLEIRDHVASEYTKISCDVSVDGAPPVDFPLKPDASACDEEGRLSDETVAKRVVGGLNGLACGAMTRVEARSTPSPLPFNLTELTAHMSRVAKMSAARVMAATQSLRDGHRAITYNRSDCPYLPTEAFRDAPATLATAAANLGVSWPLDFSDMPRCFDDAKIDAHTGIIPQDVAVDVSALSADERLVYEEVCKRYAMQFAGDERFEVSSTTVGVPGGTLSHVAKRTVTPGWRAISDDGRGSKGYQEGWLDAGAHSLVVRHVGATRERTKPKRPYTEGTLVKAMANAARLVSDPDLKAALLRKDEGKPGEHGSIGTTATRPDIIEKLKARGFIAEGGNRLVATQLGLDFYRACPPDIRSVDTTARWWLVQERVAAGEADEYAVAEGVIETFEGHRDSAWMGVSLSPGGALCKCPLCGGDVIDPGPRSKAFRCSSNTYDRQTWALTGGCGFELWKEQYHHRLTARQARDLCERGRTATIRGLVGKSGKPFDARLTMDEKGHVGIEFAKGRGRKG